jgi:hypothetical protein
MLAKARVKASETGQPIDGSLISNAQKLAFHNSQNKKGDPLSVTTAMSGAGLLAKYRILEKKSQRFTKGYGGLAEHVMDQQGITGEEREGLMSMDQSLKSNRSIIQKTGGTEDRGLNTALAELIGRRKNKSLDSITKEDMKSATDDEILQAAVTAQEEAKNNNKKIFDMGAAQYNVTSSIGDKIDNVISFLLEQILRVLDPLAEYLDKIVSGIFGLWKDSGQEKVKKADEITDNLKGYAKNRNDQTWKKAGGDQFLDIVSADVKRGSVKGHSGEKLVQDLASS